MKLCENCGNPHDGQYGSGRFCSSKCSRGFSTKEKRKEINEKVSKSLLGKPSFLKGTSTNRKGLHLIDRKIMSCLVCGKEKEVLITNTNKFCSRNCSSSYTQKQLAKEGRHNGYPSRLNKKPSWAEQFTIDLLNKEQIKYIRDHKVNRFFADFAFIDKKVILEIDGKQHEERKEYDVNRDNIIKKEGWKIVRIQWKHRNFKLMESQIKTFLKNNITG